MGSAMELLKVKYGLVCVYGGGLNLAKAYFNIIHCYIRYIIAWMLHQIFMYFDKNDARSWLK